MTQPNTAVAIPQMTFLELITIQFGTNRIPTFWQRFNGGEIQVATARHAAPDRRTTRAFAGKYSVSAISMERDYIPDQNQGAVLTGILNYLRDPANPENQIRVTRELPNTPSAAGNTTTIITYTQCVPTMIPVLADGDTTNDASIMLTRLAFEVGEPIINIGGQVYDIGFLIGGGWSGLGAGPTNNSGSAALL